MTITGVIYGAALGVLLLGATSPSLAQSSDGNYKFTTNQLPDASVMPTLANGQIGFVAYSGYVHLNGVYNGVGGKSHRARVRNYGNIQLADCAQGSAPNGCTYQLDMRSGKFVAVREDQGYRLVHEVYPHRYYDTVLVNRVRIQRLGSQAIIQTRLVQTPGLDSPDFVMEPRDSFIMSGIQYYQECGLTVQMEHPSFQSFGHNVCITFQSVPDQLQITPDVMAQEFLIYTVFSTTADEGRQQIAILQRLNEMAIDQLHDREMDKLWERYGITVEGNQELDRVVKASAFYLFSSLPAHSVALEVDRYPFYGLAPAGLGRGGEVEKEYQGHSFWDTEIWMYPSILLVDPINALKVLRYRNVVSSGARANAAKNGFQGAQFPWESAFTGSEVTPECCPEVVNYQHHITADIAFAYRQYFYATGDMTWFRNEACPLALETARFWSSRVDYNNATDLFDIHNAMGPDEDHPDVTNNAFTNIMAAHNLFFGEFASCYCQQLAPEKDEGKEFLKIGRGLTLLYDAEGDFHPQFDGYQSGTPIKQADTVLLIYPLQHPMNVSTKMNNLRKYSQVTRENGPAMTWAIHTIGHLELNELNEAATMFQKSYQQYLRAPFNVWSENGNNEPGAGNFITGAGGFLQAIINGYAGVRLHQDRLVISNSRLTPGTRSLHLPTIEYQQVQFSLTVQSDRFVIKFKTEGRAGVQVTINNKDEPICKDCEYSGTEAIIRLTSTPEVNGCRLRPTELNIRVADQSDSAITNSVAFVTLIVTFLLSRLF